MTYTNPDIYTESDVLNFPSGLVSAKSIWDKDKAKKDIAEKYGYSIIYLWEKDIRIMTDDDLCMLLLKLTGMNNAVDESKKDKED